MGMHMKMTILGMAILGLWVLSCGGDDVPSQGDGQSNGEGDTDTSGDGNGNGSDGTGGTGNGDDTSETRGTDTHEADFDECADIPWSVEVQPINLLVLLDRSASMVNYEMDGKTYAAIVEEAINAIVLQNTTSGIINFALNVFPSAENCTDQYRIDTLGGASGFDIYCEAASLYYWPGAPVNVSERPAPGDYLVPTVPFRSTVSMDTYGDIQNALSTMGQCGGTPICQSLWWAAEYLDQLNSDNQTYILLATDGGPNCNPALNPSTCRPSSGDAPSFGEQCLDDTCAMNVALYLATRGYRTYVVGVGDEAAVFENVLDAIAYWGGANGPACEFDPATNPYFVCPPPTGRDNWFFPAGNATELSAAFEEITNATMTCEFEVPWGEVPDYDPTDPEKPVAKACNMVQAKAVVPGADADEEDETDPNRLIYDAGCHERSSFGWRWADEALSNASWAEVELERGTDNCQRIQLCPRACEKLHIRGGEREWQSVSASFGCQPVIAID